MRLSHCPTFVIRLSQPYGDEVISDLIGNQIDGGSIGVWVPECAKKPTILMVDDDIDDIYLAKRAFCSQVDGLVFRGVQSGDELIDYLNCSGKHSGITQSDIPDVILLDINMPQENGFEILHRIRSDKDFSHMPVTMLTTSTAPHYVNKAYEHGANSYLGKSVYAAEMKIAADRFYSYWFSSAQLPCASVAN